MKRLAILLAALVAFIGIGVPAHASLPGPSMDRVPVTHVHGQEWNAVPVMGRNPDPVPDACGRLDWGNTLGPNAFFAPDGSYVWGSGTSKLMPYEFPACDKVYLGWTSNCGWFRFVVINPPNPTPPYATYGAWFRSCWTPQPGSSCECGWIKSGYDIVIQQKADTGDARNTAFSTWV